MRNVRSLISPTIILAPLAVVLSGCLQLLGNFGNNQEALDCPTGYIEVPGNASLGTSAFCVLSIVCNQRRFYAAR